MSNPLFDDPNVPFDDPNTMFDGGGGSLPGLPVITALDVNSGPDSGGTTVTITGQNFGTTAPQRFTFNDSGFAIPIFEITPNIDAVLDRVQAEGGKTLRTDAYWAALQPTNPTNAAAGQNDTWDLAGAVADLDAVYAGCLARSIHPIFCAGYAPDWAHPGHTGDKIPPTRDQTTYADYANLAVFLANRYPLATLEAWNEPNISVFWKQPAATSTTGAVDSPDVVEYAKALKYFHIGVKTGIVVGRAIQTAQPTVLVLSGGMSPATGSGAGDNYAPLTFLHGILRDSYANFDHVGYHPYQWQYDPNGTQTWNSMFQLLSMWAALKAVRSDADFWATECGIISRPNVSGTDPSSENGVGGFVTGAVGPAYNTSGRAINYTLSKTRATQMIGAWKAQNHFDADVSRFFVGPMCIFKLNDTAAPTDWSDDEDHFGLFEGPGYTGPAKPHAAIFSTFFSTSSATGGPVTVTVGGTQAVIVSISDTQIVITTPAHIAGTVAIQVTTPSGTSALVPVDRFTYTSVSTAGAPTILGLSPSFGPYSGGTSVTITGTGFAHATAVAFGALPASFTIVSDTTILAISPAESPGHVDVSVTNGSGVSGVSAGDVFVYNPPTPPLTRTWVLYARDGNNKRQGQIEDYTACTFLINQNAVGTFSVTVPWPSQIATLLLQPRSGIVIEADGREVFSGPGRGRLRQNQNGTQSLVFSGVDDNVWLQARLAHPQPSTPIPPYSTQTYDIRTGVASTVLLAYVNANLGPAALAARRIPALSLAPDPLVGSTISGRGRWQQLLTMMQQLANASTPNLTFRILQSGDALVFSVSIPTDRTASVVFSAAAGTLGDFEYQRTGAEDNYIYGGGAGEATGRMIVEDENGDDINEWGRFEEFLDRRDITTATELEQAIQAEIRAQTGTFRTDLTIIDTAGLSWPNDYDVGDIATVDLDGVDITEQVRALQVDLGGSDDDTEKITPSVSSPTPSATVRERRIYQTLRDLLSRVGNLERQ